MKKEKNLYIVPVVRVVEMQPEQYFLQSGGNGSIDPGTDDPWGDY